MTHRAAGLVLFERSMSLGHLLVHSLAGCIDLCGNVGGGLGGEHGKLSDLKFATTAKPRPALPARAASISAFSASRLVCWAME
jgi:hypothetical protein